MARWRLTLSFLLLCWFYPGIQCQIFSTFMEIRKLVEVERNLVDRFLDYFQRQSKNGVFIDQSAIDFVEFADVRNAAANETLSHHHDNPLCTYHAVKRASDGWEALRRNLSCTGSECPLLTGEDVFNAAMKRNGVVWPTKVNLHHAALAIINIWNVYDLDINDLAKGKVKDVVNDPLTADDIFFIASAATDAGLVYEGLSWHQFLVDNKASLPDGVSFSPAVLYRRLAGAYQQYGMVWKSVQLLEAYVKTDAENKAVMRDLSYFRSSLTSSDERKELKRFQDENSSEARNTKLYESTCRGGNKISTRLLCFRLPLYRTYGIVKVEEIAGFPRILIFHDVISDLDMQRLLNFTSAKMLNLREAMRTADSVRSTTMCGSNLGAPEVRLLTRRFAEVTGLGLSARPSTCYKFSSHSTGGTYSLTTDYLGKPSKSLLWLIERVDLHDLLLATVMFQLSDLSYGGETVFPKIQASIPVAKGSMAFWYNLRSSGHQDSRTAHIDCPVLVGAKWTAMRTIGYDWQIAGRTCDAVTGRG